MQEVYAGLLIAVGVDEYSAQIQLDHCSMLGVKFRDMANLLSPDAVFSMEQSAVPLDLGVTNSVKMIHKERSKIDPPFYKTGGSFDNQGDFCGYFSFVSTRKIYKSNST